MHAAGLEVSDIESLREHYPLTLRHWAANLQAHKAEAIASVGHERERAWRLYMLGSRPSFRRRRDHGLSDPGGPPRSPARPLTPTAWATCVPTRFPGLRLSSLESLNDENAAVRNQPGRGCAKRDVQSS
jgi:hypothetical protein